MMNTKKRLICIGACGIGVIVLVVAVLLVQLLPKKGDTDVTQNGDVTPTYARELDEIYTINARQIASVTIKNSTGEYELVRSSDGKVTMKGAESVPLLSETVSNLFTSVQIIYSENLIEADVKDLSVYGLDTPAVTLSVNSTRGFTDVFLIGDKTPDGGAYYFLIDGETTVWCVNTYFAERVMKPQSGFFDLTVSKPYEEADFISLSIDYNDKSKNYEFRQATDKENSANLYADSMVMTSPFLFGANTSNVRGAARSVASLSADGVVNVAPTAEDLKKYGFTSSSPVVRIGFEVDVSQKTVDGVTNPYYDSTATESKKITLYSTYLIGGKENGKLYLMYDDTNVIYAVSDEYFGFVDYTPDKFCQSLVFIRYLNDLSAFEVKGGGRTFKFDVSTEIGDDGSVTYHGYYNGKELTAKYMQNLYREIISVSNLGLASDPGGKAAVTVTCYGKNGNDSKVEFVPLGNDGLYYFCRVNGTGHFYVSSALLDRILKDAQALSEGKEVSFEY